MAKNPHKLMSKVHFNLVFSNAWAKAAVPSNAVAGFKKAGIHPLNEEAIPVHNQSSGTSNNSSASNHSNSITNNSTSSSIIPNNIVTSDAPTSSISTSNKSTSNFSTSNNVSTNSIGYTDNNCSTVNNPLSLPVTESSHNTDDDHLASATKEFCSEVTCNDTNNMTNNSDDQKSFTAAEVQLFD